MTTVIDVLNNFVDVIGNAGSSPLPPDPSTLGAFSPELSKLQRDRQGIIMMPQASCGEIKPDLDGGDSAHREGVAAFCNSDQDKKLLELFENKTGWMVRHPTQEPWNRLDNSTMDQLRGFMVGCWRAGRTDIAQRLLVAHKARDWKCQNTFNPERCPKVTKGSPRPPDVVQPHEIMCLHIAGGLSTAYLDPFSQFWLYIAIQTAKKDKEEDNNNLMFISIVCGRLDIFLDAHPNWKDFVKYYWRSQAPLGEAVIEVVEKERARYAGRTKIPLLPAETMKLLKSLNVSKELTNLDPGHRADLAGRFATAAINDAAKLFSSVSKLSAQETIQRLKAIMPPSQDPKVVAEQIVKVLQDNGIPAPPDALNSGLSAAGIPSDVIGQVIKTITPGSGTPIPIPPIPNKPPIRPPDPDPRKWRL
jgi:hypothetical protein